ncbi:hypothetical protein LSAT2_019089 [Lamellibrachia satsuma]|nr:hypothetical protein LSAT2_019089 [Lamellibrachia satsuma]
MELCLLGKTQRSKKRRLKESEAEEQTRRSKKRRLEERKAEEQTRRSKKRRLEERKAEGYLCNNFLLNLAEEIDAPLKSSLVTRQFQLGLELDIDHSRLCNIMRELTWSRTFDILKVWRDDRRNLDNSTTEKIHGLCKALAKLERADLVEFVQHGEFIECAII